MDESPSLAEGAAEEAPAEPAGEAATGPETQPEDQEPRQSGPATVSPADEEPLTKVGAEVTEPEPVDQPDPQQDSAPDTPNGAQPDEILMQEGVESALADTASDAGAPSPLPELILPPLEPGVILKDRYVIVSLLEESPQTLLYDALDRGRCAQCGYADSELGDMFCPDCGASLTDGAETPHVRLRSVRMAGEAFMELEGELAEQVERWFEAEGRLYAVIPLAEPTAPDEPASFRRGVRHLVGHNSDPGLRRELNEDAILALTLTPVFESRSCPSLGLYAVADGMGGHEGGEVASRITIETLAESIVKRLFLPELSGDPVLPETPPLLLEEAIQLINTQIYQLQQTTGSDMGTTLTAALVRDDHALIANVGDSRTYLWRDGQLTQITADHSLVAQLAATGVISPDEIYTHPEKSAIYRSLGHMPFVDVDLFAQPLQPGDWLVLCSDGAWEMLRDDGIEEVLLLEADPQRACDEIVLRANLAGGDDNISIVAAKFEELRDEGGARAAP